MAFATKRFCITSSNPEGNSIFAITKKLPQQSLPSILMYFFNPILGKMITTTGSQNFVSTPSQGLLKYHGLIVSCQYDRKIRAPLHIYSNPLPPIAIYTIYCNIFGELAKTIFIKALIEKTSTIIENRKEHNEQSFGVIIKVLTKHLL